MEFKSLLFFSLALLSISLSHADDDEKVQIEVVHVPENCERKSAINDKLSMQYIGTLTETGVKFDSSYDRGKTFDFQLGAGQVIRGWDEGLLDMCEGEKRRLVVPASKGYGAQGAGDVIPPNAGLSFEVELVAIQDGSPPPNVFKAIDENGDKLLTQEEVSSYLKKQSAEFSKEGSPEDDQHNELVTQIFSHEDKDKDGFISHEEFSGPKHDEL